MIVNCFWLWSLAPRVQMLYDGFWAPFCRVSIPNLPMPLEVCCLVFPLHFASLALGGDCWGSLMFVYNGSLVAKAGIDVNLNVLLLYVLFNLKYCCMVYCCIGLFSASAIPKRVLCWPHVGWLYFSRLY